MNGDSAGYIFSNGDTNNTYATLIKPSYISLDVINQGSKDEVYTSGHNNQVYTSQNSMSSSGQEMENGGLQPDIIQDSSVASVSVGQSSTQV